MRMKKVLYTAVTAAAATMLIAGYGTSKSVFCKPFLHKVAKPFCRLLQLHFVGYCNAFARMLKPDKNALQTLLFNYVTE